jgi:hypothetical protein
LTFPPFVQFVFDARVGFEVAGRDRAQQSVCEGLLDYV